MIFLVILFIFYIIFQLWGWFQPAIEIIVFDKHYMVYLWYNKRDDANCKRVYKYLFKI